LKKAVRPPFFIQDRRVRADEVIVRAQSVVRADGMPSAQALALQFDVSCYLRQCRQA
jgi:hypothetical protein